MFQIFLPALANLQICSICDFLRRPSEFFAHLTFRVFADSEFSQIGPSDFAQILRSGFLQIYVSYKSVDTAFPRHINLVITVR